MASKTSPASDKVSIVLASYNYGRFIEESIQSCLNQTHHAIELLIIDDGSTDNSVERVQPYLKDKRVRLITQKNSGVCTVLNRGFKEATGDYLMAFSADDVLHQDYLKETMQIFKTDDALGFVYPSMQLFGTEERYVEAVAFDRTRLCFDNYVCGSSVMRRVAYFEAGGIKLKNENNYEDWDLWLSMMEKGWSGAPAAEAIFYYRQHGQSRNKVLWVRRQKYLFKIRRQHVGLYLKHAPLWILRKIKTAFKMATNGEWSTMVRALKHLIKYS